jgi:hypothetical protein
MSDMAEGWDHDLGGVLSGRALREAAEIQSAFHNTKTESRRGIRAPRRLLESNFLPSNLLLAHPECIERRLVDRRCLGEPLVGLVGGERLPRQRPEQSIHLTLVIAHLL